MDLSSPEVVAARAVAVVAIERLLRARTAPLLWLVTALAALLVAAAVFSDGLGAVVLGAGAVVATAVASTLFLVRAVVLRGLRRVAGGPDYVRVRPIVERRMAEVERAGAVIPLDSGGILRLAWLARRPRDLQDHVRQTGTTITRVIPEVVADIRRELPGPRELR
ncbi:MAG TPA: hypothetical protein VMZ22_01675 [Acidimicrobiales bacterium]|nr:hypothetical protein [Acidimicrobiales bacterium]